MVSILIAVLIDEDRHKDRQSGFAMGLPPTAHAIFENETGEEVNVIMRKLMLNVLVGAVALAWAGHVLAEDPKPKKEPPKRATIECEVVSVNADAKSIEVKEGDKTETLTLTKNAKVIVNGEEKSLADLKAGDKCKCTVYEKKDGSRSVSRIVVGENLPKAATKKATSD